MAQMKIRGNTQIKDLSIENLQIADSTIELAKLAAGADIILRDGSVAMTWALAMWTQKITWMADGTVATDGATQWQLATAIWTTLLKANNLSDLQDVAIARTNLDVYSKGEVDALTTGALNYKGTLDFSVITDLPNNWTKWDFYKISWAGTVEGIEWAVGDMIIFNTDTAADTAAADVDKIDNTEAADILRDADVSTNVDLTVDWTKLADRTTISTAIDNKISAANWTPVRWEEPVVTDASADVTLANIPVELWGVYLNGLRTKYFGIAWAVITFDEVLEAWDDVYVDYKY